MDRTYIALTCQDTATEKCILHSETGDHLPRADFSKNRLGHRREGTGFLYCIRCEERLKSLKDRLEKTKYKCACKKLSHNPSFEKCPLFAQRGNWPGKDFRSREEHVSVDDGSFLNRLPKQNRQSNWWYKLLGKL